MSDATPLISVVIPTYNHARYLASAVQSVLDQTYVNWEAIVIDNHSTDNTDEVMASFADNRITYLKIHNNGVIAASRNAGIRAAKGEWIAFLDSDDYWTAEKLQACTNIINENVDLIYHDLEIIEERPRIIKRKIAKSWKIGEPVLLDMLIKGNPILNSSVVVRKRLLEKIGGINEAANMVAAEDYNTWLRLAKITNQFVQLPCRLGYYLLHTQGVSMRDTSLAYRAAIIEFTVDLNDVQRAVIESKFNYIAARCQLRNGEYDKSIATVKNSIRNARGQILFRMLLVLIFCGVGKMYNLISRRT